MKKVLAILLAATMLFAFAACGGNKTNTDANTNTDAATTSDLDYVKANGKLVIGYTEFAPMNYYDDETGDLIGFDTEFADAVGPLISLPAAGPTPSAIGVKAGLPSGVAPVCAPSGTFADTG